MFVDSMAEQGNDDDTAADIQRLAREYVDLWEQQVKTLAGDEGFATAMSKTFELMNAGAASMSAMTAGATAPKQGTENESGNHPEFGAGAQSKRGAGTETVGAASGYSDDDVHQLLERIAELEHRVAELERERSAQS